MARSNRLRQTSKGKRHLSSQELSQLNDEIAGEVKPQLDKIFPSIYIPEKKTTNQDTIRSIIKKKKVINPILFDSSHNRLIQSTINQLLKLQKELERIIEMGYSIKNNTSPNQSANIILYEPQTVLIEQKEEDIKINSTIDTINPDDTIFHIKLNNGDTFESRMSHKAVNDSFKKALSKIEKNSSIFSSISDKENQEMIYSS